MRPHAVQQKQGRVKPTLQAGGVKINDDEGLEQEAERLGKEALMGRGTSTGTMANYGNHISRHLAGSRGDEGRGRGEGGNRGLVADSPVQRLIRLRVNTGSGPKTQTLGQDQDAFKELGALVIFRWYLGKVTEGGVTAAAVRQTLAGMQAGQQTTWNFDVADQGLISTFLEEVDRRLGLAQPTWDLKTYRQERALYENTSVEDIGEKPKKPSLKKTTSTKVDFFCFSRVACGDPRFYYKFERLWQALTRLPKSLKLVE